MTPWEITRLLCYAIAAPCALYLALYSYRARDYWRTLLLGSLAGLMVWYVIEITISSTGVNTREYRIIGTPLVITMTVALAGLAFRVHTRQKGKG